MMVDSVGSTKMAQVSHDEGVEHRMDATEETLDLSKVVCFHAKEQFSTNKSFMHNRKYNLVRIAVGRDGIYKLDSISSKVLSHWQFRDIRDSSYSGFSFTLKFKGNKLEYNVRTDDGEPICYYIEAFQMNPEKALEHAHLNPPVSNIPESGLMTLRRKFSSENKVRPIEPGMFYTLNHKTTRKNDPNFNLDVDTQIHCPNSDSGQTTPTPGQDDDVRRCFSLDTCSLTSTTYKLSGGGRKLAGDGRKLAGDGRKLAGDGHYLSSTDLRSSSSSSSLKMNGGVAQNGAPQDKKQAREVLTQHIKVAKETEKRLSNGVINHTPISTRGEASNDTPTNSSLSSLKRSSSNSPIPLKKTVQVDHMTSFHKAGSAPPTLPAEGEGEVQEVLPTPSISKAQGSKHLNMLGIVTFPSTPSDHSPLSMSTAKRSSYDHISPLSPPFSSSSTEVTPLCSGSNRFSSSSPQMYDHLDDVPILVPANIDDPSNTSQTITPTDQSVSYDDISYSERCRSNNSDTSSVYDHLNVASPTPPPGDVDKVETSTKHEVHCQRNTVTLGIVGDFASRRNISQPALSTPNSARESPCDFGSFRDIADESRVTPTNSDDEEWLEDPMTPSKTEFEGVTLRQKKKDKLITEDPFADLLSPKHASRLRWSQELNPLYDYIKRFKMADGVKMYDSNPPSKLVQSSSAAGIMVEGMEERASVKLPSMIMEEEEGEEGSVLSWDPGDTLSVTSQDTISLMSQDTQHSPTSPTSSCGGEGFGDTLSVLGRSRRPHAYEDIMAMRASSSASSSSVPTPSPMVLPESIKRSESEGNSERLSDDQEKPRLVFKGSTILGCSSHLTIGVGDREGKLGTGMSPRLGKREIRRSRTLAVRDDSEMVKCKQKPVRVADALKDFSFVMREYRLFFVKMPNGLFLREIFSINKPLSELRDRLCEILGVDDAENYELLVEGSCLSTLRETETGVDVVRVNRTGLNYMVDSQILPDQGTDPIVLRVGLSFRMQGITTSRILSLKNTSAENIHLSFSSSELPAEEDEFPKCWISVVQGNLPCTQDSAVKLAALQYQAYFLDRTAVNSVVGFSRPTEFLPVEYINVRGVEAKMYKEQEELSKKTHCEIKEAYINYCSELDTAGAVFFPAREPRKKLLQSTKLKPVIFGVSPRGILRVDPKTKERLGFWSYSVLKNWAYSKRTFVLAFTNKSFPVESNQAKWICMLVDFFVDSIITTNVVKASTQQKRWTEMV